MYEQILIATDGSELAQKGLAHGLDLARKYCCPVAAVTVTEPWSALDMAHESDGGTKNPIAHYETLARTAAKHVLDNASKSANALKIDLQCIHAPDKAAADGILETAEKIGADLIVMTSHGRRGIRRVLLGSVAHEVATRSHVPVLIVR